MAADPVDEQVPKLPRGRGITLSVPQLVRIVGLIGVLVFLLVMQKPCANAVSRFVTGFDGSAAKPGTAGAVGSGSATRSLESYEHLRPGMTDDEVKSVIERAKLKAAGSAATGSAGAGSAAAGSAAPKP